MKNLKYHDNNFDCDEQLDPLESGWYGHVYFAYDLVAAIKPKKIVELGTHKGHSFFSFCQAVKDEGLETELFAVDTWKGDEHAGFYQDDIFLNTQDVLRKYYGYIKAFLIRATFDEAVQQFEDNSIDILHIDGMHTYEAVKHDFENWFPKVSANGIIILHDISVKERGFGVYRLWNELKKDFNTLEFKHSNGLGVLFKSDEMGSYFKDENLLRKYYESKSLEKVTSINFSKEIKLFEELREKLEIELNKKEKEISTKNLQIERYKEDIAFMQSSKFWKVRSLYVFLKNGVKFAFLNPEKFFLKHFSKIKKLYRSVIFSLKTEGPSIALKRIRNYILMGKGKIEIMEEEDFDRYERWIEGIEKKYRENIEAEFKSNIKKLNYQPKISIIMPVYNSDEIFLRKAIFSVVYQLYENWELCIVDDCSSKKIISPILQEFEKRDPRIKIIKLEENSGISVATNKGVKMASGEFACLLDHDDEIEPYALYEVVRKLNENRDLDFIYSDDDKIDQNGRRYDPQFKPDWSPELLLSYCYVSHLKVVRRKLFTEIEGFRKEFDGSQDYDFMLRLSEVTNKAGRIPLILYHWRCLPGSVAASTSEKPQSLERGRKAVQQAIDRRSIKGEVVMADFAEKSKIGVYKIEFYRKYYNEKVTIIIPTKDNLELLSRCIESVKTKTDYPNFEILVVSNNSEKKETEDYLKENNIKFITINNGYFNFSHINNEAAKVAESELILFLNNDTEVISEKWLLEMVGTISMNEKIGAVGAKLLYPDKRVQHGGVVLGLNNQSAGHANKLILYQDAGYLNYAHVIRNYSAVTAACMLTKKNIFEKVGGLDEKNLAVSYNDVDYCLKLGEKGYRIVFNPYALLYHHEGKSRGFGDDVNELNYLKRRWGKFIEKDPFYNENLSLKDEKFRIRYE